MAKGFVMWLLHQVCHVISTGGQVRYTCYFPITDPIHSGCICNTVVSLRKSKGENPYWNLTVRNQQTIFWHPLDELIHTKTKWRLIWQRFFFSKSVLLKLICINIISCYNSYLRYLCVKYNGIALLNFQSFRRRMVLYWKSEAYIFL